MNEQKDFSILFKSLEDAKNDCDYLFLEEAMQNTEILKDPIEKLQEIVMDSETVNYSILISA